MVYIILRLEHDAETALAQTAQRGEVVLISARILLIRGRSVVVSFHDYYLLIHGGGRSHFGSEELRPYQQVEEQRRADREEEHLLPPEPQRVDVHVNVVVVELVAGVGQRRVRRVELVVGDLDSLVACLLEIEEETVVA